MKTSQNTCPSLFISLLSISITRDCWHPPNPRGTETKNWYRHIHIWFWDRDSSPEICICISDLRSNHQENIIERLVHFCEHRRCINSIVPLPRSAVPRDYNGTGCEWTRPFSSLVIRRAAFSLQIADFKGENHFRRSLARRSQLIRGTRVGIFYGKARVIGSIARDGCRSNGATGTFCITIGRTTGGYVRVCWYRCFEIFMPEIGTHEMGCFLVRCLSLQWT